MKAFGKDAALNQEFIGRLAGLDERLLKSRSGSDLHDQPAPLGHAHRRPLLQHHRHQDLGAQHIATTQVHDAFEFLHAHAQQIEVLRRRLQHQFHEARHHDLGLHDFLILQFELDPSRLHRLQPGCGFCQILLPRLDGRSAPVLALQLKLSPGIASQLHFGRGPYLAHHGREGALDGASQTFHGSAHLQQKTLASLATQLYSDSFSLCVRHTSCFHQTVAPALGSFGSSLVLVGPPLIRSSRWIPSHMAMAAATNTDE